MRLLAGLFAAVLFVAVFHSALKKVPSVFYAAAALAVAGYLYGIVVGLPAWMWKSMLFFMQKNVLAFALFTLVMLAGALPSDTQPRKTLMSVRRELSVMACILSLGHILVFGCQYLARLVSQATLMDITLLAAFAAALCCVCLMAPLAITSLNVVRERMKPRAWKHVQLLAYPFFLFAGVHVLLFLGPSAAGSGGDALGNAVAYGVLLFVYIALRTGKALQQRHVEKHVSVDIREA